MRKVYQHKIITERQVADAARNVAQKLHLVNQICQSEEQHINEMEYFLYYYLDPIDAWIHEAQSADTFQKYPGLCSEKALIDLFQITKQITKSHQELFRGLKER
jgi:rubrerythrin